MGPVIFEFICADCAHADNVLFTLNDDYERFHECVDDCLVWCDIVFYGIPVGLTDDQMEEIYERNYRHAVRIGRLTGCLILARDLLEMDEDPLMACDAADADLGYIMAALTDTDGPLNEETGDFYQDVFYLHDLEIGKKYGDLYKGKILDDLPNLIFSFLHVVPDVFAFYPAPLRCAKDPQGEGNELLPSIVAKKGQVSGSSYPVDTRDLKEYAFYKARGYREAGGSGVLYRHL